MFMYLQNISGVNVCRVVAHRLNTFFTSTPNCSRLCQIGNEMIRVPISRVKIVFFIVVCLKNCVDNRSRTCARIRVSHHRKTALASELISTFEKIPSLPKNV